MGNPGFAVFPPSHLHGAPLGCCIQLEGSVRHSSLGWILPAVQSAGEGGVQRHASALAAAARPHPALQELLHGSPASAVLLPRQLPLSPAVTQNEGCTPAELIAVFNVPAVSLQFFPYTEASALIIQHLSLQWTAAAEGRGQPGGGRGAAQCMRHCARCHTIGPLIGEPRTLVCVSPFPLPQPLPCPRPATHMLPCPAGLPARQHHQQLLRRQGRQQCSVEARGHRSPG